MKLGMWLSGNMLIMNVIFSPLQEHCVYYGNRNSQIVAKSNLSQIKAIAWWNVVCEQVLVMHVIFDVT